MKKLNVLLLFISIAAGSLCSNDTRTGLPNCTGSCSAIRECWNVSTDLYCDSSVHSDYVVADETVHKWLGQCWKLNDPRNYSSMVTLELTYDNLPFFGNDTIRAYLDSDCESQGCYNGTMCNGNLKYCEAMDALGGGCDIGNQCYCELFAGFEEERLFLNNEFVTADRVSVCFGQNHLLSEALFRSEREIYEPGPYGWEGRTEVETIGKRAMLTSGVSVTWEQPIVSVFTLSPRWTFLFLTKTGLNLQLPCDLTQNDFDLPEQWSATTEPILYRVYINMTLIDSGNLATRRIFTCEDPGCIFCSEYIGYFACASPAMKTKDIFFFLLVGVSSILAIVIIWMIIKNSIAGYNINLQMPNMNQALQTTVVFLAMFGRLGVLGCDVSYSVPSSNYECVVSGTMKTCVLNEQVLVTIPLPGYEACFDLVDTNTKTIDGRLIIVYIEMIKKATVTLEYWTSAWEVVTESIKYCPAKAQCTTGNDCNTNRTGLTYINQGGTLTGQSILYPGYSQCITTCGCAGCNCFVCDSGCIYSRWALKPVGQTYKVLAVSAVSIQPTIRMCLVNVAGNSTCYKTGVNRATEIVFNPLFGSIQYLGSLVGENTVFGTNKFIMSADGTQLAYGPAALPSLPALNGIGDIQSGSQNGLMNPTTGSFIFHPNMGQASDSGESSAVFLMQSVGFNEFSLLPKSPINIGSTIWHADGNTALIGIDGNPGAIQLIVKIKNHTFISVVDQVCPKMISRGIVGCYLCNGGAMWIVQANSDCSPGSCVLTTDTTTMQLNTASLRLGTADGTYYVNMTAALKEGDVKLTCSTGDYSDSITAHYKLEEPHTVINPNGTTPSVVPGIPTDGPGGIQFDLSKWLGISLGGGFLTIFIIVCIVVVVYMCRGGKTDSTTIINNIKEKFNGKTEQEYDLDLLRTSDDDASAY